MSSRKLFIEGHELAVLNRYYIWLVDMVDFDSHDNYSKLLEYLYNKNYIWKVRNDDNRAEDGKKLREKFKSQTDYLDYSSLIRPCSVLEMLVAFSDRIDKDVMPTDDGSDNLAYWFWLMLDNLGLTDCTDDHFDEEFVDKTLDIWMNREYDLNQKGNLFLVKTKKNHFKELELWFQMHQYIAENYD